MQALLEALRQRVLVRRVLVKPFFSDYEQQVNSAKVIDHITRNQTIQALSRFGVELDTAQAELLLDRTLTLTLTLTHTLTLTLTLALTLALTLTLTPSAATSPSLSALCFAYDSLMACSRAWG